MFEGFTEETGRFLWDLSFNNERPWFKAHKEQFERCLGVPFKALAGDVFQLMRERFPWGDWRLHVSRIYRDARRLYGRGPYNDNLWFSVLDGGSPGVGFWMEVNAVTYIYGAGLYDAAPAQMEAFRRGIDANPARFERLAAQMDALGRFKVVGEEYKRPKGDRGELINKWYNRKWVGLERAVEHDADMMSPRLPEIVVEDFDRIMPMYEYLAEFCRAYDNSSPLKRGETM